MSAQPITLAVEALENRLTPSTSSVLVPAFYGDLLHRTPDFPGASGFAKELDTGVDPAKVAYQIETAPSNEYFFALVQSYYGRFLHRRGSGAELSSFVNNYFAAGATDEQVQAVFLGSDEYFRQHWNDGLTWLDAMYQDVLGRQDIEGANLDALATTSRQNIATGILNSQEFATAQVTRYYQQFLDRSGYLDPGIGGFAGELLAGTKTDEQIIADMLGSPEYLARNTPVPLGTVGPGVASGSALAYGNVAANGAVSYSSHIVGVIPRAGGTAGTYCVVLDSSINAAAVHIDVAPDYAANSVTMLSQPTVRVRVDNAYTPTGVNGISIDTFTLNTFTGATTPADMAFIIAVS